MSISIRNVAKRFGTFSALKNVSLEIAPGSLVALLGPSGSGKSTLLRIIAGLEPPDAGEIWMLGQNATVCPVQERGIGFVFQHYALFKHLTVRENIAFPLTIRKAPEQQTKQRVEELLNLVQLQGFGDRYPSQLSGGQRQRVALARSLAVRPQILLLDEPFGALDAKVRKELRDWLRRLHREVQVTTIFVTHDQEEAMEVADEIVVMNQGRIEQVGTPAELYDRPATPFVMSFVGPVNVLPINAGILPNTDVIEGDRIFLRPHDVLIQTHPSADTVPAQVERVIHLGWEIQVELRLNSERIVLANLERDSFRQLQIQRHQQVYVKPKQVKTFPSYAFN